MNYYVVEPANGLDSGVCAVRCPGVVPTRPRSNQLAEERNSAKATLRGLVQSSSETSTNGEIDMPVDYKIIKGAKLTARKTLRLMLVAQYRYHTSGAWI